MSQSSSEPDLSRRLLLRVGTGALALATGGAAWAMLVPARPDVFADPAAPLLGNPKGDVRVAVWFDYQCGYCREADPLLTAEARRDGRVAILHKAVPIFGDLSVRAHRIAWSARRQGRYDGFHTGVMSIKGQITEDRLDGAIAAAGIDRARLQADMAADAPAFAAATARNLREARALGMSGTPFFAFGDDTEEGMLGADGIREAIAVARRARA